MNKRNEGLVGKRFGRLLVIEKTNKKNKHGCLAYKCLCDCGKEHISYSNALNKKAGTRSCGCSRRPSKVRKAYGESSFRNLYQTYRNHAKQRNLEFCVTENEFKVLTKGNCYYCGSPPNKVAKASGRSYGEYIYNGVDRIDNFMGYVLENCVPCCKSCNRAKDVKSKDEFLLWVKSIYNYSNLGGLG